MWYFAWILGIGVALAFGIINVMWLETNYFLGDLDEAETKKRFKERAAEAPAAPGHGGNDRRRR